MNDLKLMYDIITAIWKLCKKYGAGPLSDEQWEQFIADGEQLQQRYRGQGPELETLYRDLFRAVLGFYQRKGRGT